MLPILAAVTPAQQQMAPAAPLPPYFFGFSTFTQMVFPALLILLAVYFLRRRIIDRLVKTKWLAGILHSADIWLTALTAFLVGVWKIYDPASWTGLTPPPTTQLTVVIAIAATVFCSKILVYAAGAAEREQIKDLKDARAVLETHRNWLLATINRIDEILGEKFDRIKQALKGGGEAFSRDRVEQQIVVIVHSIHSFFQEHTRYSDRLRLGLYLLDENTRNSLVQAHSWDGKSEQCFNPDSTQFLKLVRSEGATSYIVQSYVSSEKLRIVEDTAAPGSGFTFFREDQAPRIRSVLTYRFVVPDEKEDEVWVIYMDSNRPGFFESKYRAAYETFFEQATKRIAFEVMTLQLLERKKD